MELLNFQRDGIENKNEESLKKSKREKRMALYLKQLSRNKKKRRNKRKES